MTHIQTVQSIIDAWKAADHEALLDKLHDDVIYHFVVGLRPLEGKAAVRRFLEKFGAGQTQIAWRISNHLEDGDLLMVEGVDDYVDEHGVRVRTPYAGVFEFRDGKVWRWRDYVDRAAIEAAKRGEAPPEWVMPLL